MKLISMVDFVLKLCLPKENLGENYKSDYQIFYLKTKKYANFLNTPPHPSQFVAMDDDGNVLEEPIWSTPDGITWENKDEKYLSAKANIIFDGFRIGFKTSEIIGVIRDNYQIWFYKNGRVTINAKEITTISDLIPYNITLTATAQKIIGV